MPTLQVINQGYDLGYLTCPRSHIYQVDRAGTPGLDPTLIFHCTACDKFHFQVQKERHRKIKVRGCAYKPEG